MPVRRGIPGAHIRAQTDILAEPREKAFAHHDPKPRDA
jgi:hypothetical protein